MGVKTQPAVLGHVSMVHALPSLQTRGVFRHTPVGLTQLSLVQALESSQLFWTCRQVLPAALQESVVQRLLSSQFTGPGVHAPPAQVSPLVHSLPSLQLAILGVPMQRPVSMSQASLVQTF